jgi:serine/threonine protein kinase
LEIEPGTVVAQRYRVLRQLGRGGMGEVFAAENVRTGRTVAVKVLRADSKQKASAVERFRREARAAGAISSDYVTQVLDVEDDAEHGIVIVFELLEGESLIDRLKRTGPMTFDELFPIVEQVWMGLTDAHKSGVIHRDLKPSNVFLERRPDGGVRVKILDFGISKIPREVGGETLTEMGQSLGTFSFMPPEQIGKAKTVDHRADIYAASTLIFQAMSGQLPYAAKNILQMVDLKTKAEPRSLGSVLDGPVDPRLEAFLARGLAREPEKRFATAADALETWRVMKSGSARAAAGPDSTASSTITVPRASTGGGLPLAPQAAQQSAPQAGRAPATVMMQDPRSHNASPMPASAAYAGGYSNPTQHMPSVQSPPQQRPKLGATVAMQAPSFPQLPVSEPKGPPVAYSGAAAPLSSGKGPSINVPVVNDTTSEGGGDQIATIAMPVRQVAQAVQAAQAAAAAAGGIPRVHDDQERGQMGTQLMSHASLRQAGANIPQLPSATEAQHRSGSHPRLVVANPPTGAGFSAPSPGSSQARAEPPNLALPAPGEGADLTTVYRRDEKAPRGSRLPMVLGVLVVALLGFAIAALVIRYLQTGTFFWQ